MRRCSQCQVDYPDALEFCPDDGAKLPPLAGDTQSLYDPLIGSTIDGRYAITAVLGEGGMGVVYAARHVIIDKRVAIKVLRKEAATDESAAQRFLAEAKAASKIGQQNIVDITDFGVLRDGHAYFVMEFLDGPTLGKLVKDGPLAPGRAIAIAIQIARGLGAAHQKGIIHRDLKPENVFVLEREGVADIVKIVDFGIARDANAKKRLTVAGMVMGTPEYMAPEQASGQDTDHRVDQYSLGCIIYEMLTGQTPFRGDNPMQTLTKHVFEEVVPPSKRRPDLSIPTAVEDMVMRTLRKNRDDRYPNLDELMRAMQGISPSLRDIVLAPAARKLPAPGAAEPSPALGVQGTTEEIRTGAGGRRLFTVGVGLLFAAIVGLGFFFLRPHGGASVQTTPQATAPVAVVTPAAPVDLRPVAAVPSQPALPTTVRLQLSSVPEGAEVFFGDERLGRTPFESRQPRRDTPLELVFRKTGYRDLIDPVAAGSDADVAVALVPVPTPNKGSVREPGSRLDNKKVHDAEPSTAPKSDPSTPRVNQTAPKDRPPAKAKQRSHGELRDPFGD